MTKPLSPAAAAVLRAAGDSEPGIYATIAAALQAVADQVVPENVNPVGDEHDDARLFQWIVIRSQILAIAAELEGR